MSSKLTVGVVGQGFVGGSLTQVLAERGVEVQAFDKAGKVAAGGIGVQHLRDVVDCARIIFVCVPTPMLPSGECDTSIVEGALAEITGHCGGQRFGAKSTIAVVKSTVPPGSCARWDERFQAGGLRVCFSPEFLREATALADMRHQNRIVVGGPRPYVNEVKSLFQEVFPEVPIVKTSSTVAEMVKYMTNVHLAARVVLSCEMLQVCERLREAGHDIDYDKVVEYAKLDPRLGGSHMNAPGDGGIMGARGHCFPKDLAALTFLAKSLGVEPLLMAAIQAKNLALVPPEHRDWERMVGRAVSAEPGAGPGARSGDTGGSAA